MGFKRPTPPRRSHRRAVDVRRDEFEKLQTTVSDMRRELETQFKRFAQIQAELDQVKRVWVKIATKP